MCCVNYFKLTKVIDINKEMGDGISLLQLIGFMASFRRFWMEMRWANQLPGEFEIYSQNPLHWAELHGHCGLCCKIRTAVCVQWSGDRCEGLTSVSQQLVWIHLIQVYCWDYVQLVKYKLLLLLVDDKQLSRHKCVPLVLYCTRP